MLCGDVGCRTVRRVYIFMDKQETSFTFSFCSPSLGPTSTIFTLSGRGLVAHKLTYKNTDLNTNILHITVHKQDIYSSCYTLLVSELDAHVT